jgi:hypothetical protein
MWFGSGLVWCEMAASHDMAGLVGHMTGTSMTSASGDQRPEVTTNTSEHIPREADDVDRRMRSEKIAAIYPNRTWIIKRQSRPKSMANRK